ncbi:branched-chain amino acid ABC transporter permease [Candidatus Bathyarchaeota archaeon]|nr:branched-chain amino acid ABC transporter permease [Candidatus Bathyarchaeota archaeon]
MKNSHLLLLSSSVIFMLIVPYLFETYEVHIIIISLYYMVLACSWNLVAGYTGQFSVAHHAFAAVGGYTSALLAVDLGISPLVGIFVGGLAAMAISYLIGHICLKLRAIYLAVATWAFAGSLELAVRMAYKWTRGDLGLTAPRLIETASVTPYYYAGCVMTIASVVIMYRIVNSKIGLYMRSIREDEEAASVMAVDTVKWKKFIFSISGLFAGIAGAYKAHYIGLVSPVLLGFDEMAVIIMMTTIGGYGNFFGPIIGAPLIEILTEYLRVVGEIRMVLYAVVVILIARFFRGGLVGFLQLLYKRHLRGLRS